jgi:hypothetical protein
VGAVPEWVSRARCGDADPEAFYTPQGGDVLPAKQICWPCPVRVECLAAGIDETHGVWGGLTESERRQVRKGRRNGQAVDWRAAERLADPEWTVQQRRRVREDLAADYSAGVTIGKLTRRYQMTAEEVVEVLAAAGYRQTSGDDLAPLCPAGHPVAGDNRVRNGHTPSGRLRYACRRCMRARLRGVCVVCGSQSSTVVCGSCGP